MRTGIIAAHILKSLKRCGFCMYHHFHGKNLVISSTETAYKFVDFQIKHINLLSSVNRVVFIIREMRRVFRGTDRERERERDFTV